MSFVHSLFLLGGLAAAVPVLIHMSKSQNYQRVRIGTLRFLKSAVQERQRIKTIENWPLLIARICILLLLALIFARPFWPKAKPSLPSDAETIILVDSSGSLAHPDAPKRIAKIIQRIEKDLPPESTLTIAQFADVVQVTQQPQAVPGAPTDYTAAIDWTIEHLASSEHPPAAIHLITDLQQSPLPASPPRLWPADVKTEIHAVPSPANYNLAIESVTLATPFKAEEIELDAVIQIFGTPPPKKNGGRRENTAHKVLLTLSDGTKKRLPLPSEGGRVRFRWNPKDLTQLDGTISIQSSDPWPDDNERRFSFRLQERKKVLLIDGDPGATPFLGEAYFLNQALLASGATHGQSPFTTTISFDLTTRRDNLVLADYDAIALCNVTSLTEAEATALEQANAQGTGLIFLLGDKATNDGFTTLQSRNLFPDLKPTPQSQMASASRWDLTQPTLTNLATANLRGLILRDAFAYNPSSDWTPLASFANKNPFLLERANLTSGQAPVMVFAHPVTREWGDLPLASLFVPLTRELFSHLTGYNQSQSPVQYRTPGLPQPDSPQEPPTDEEPQIIINPDVVEMDPAIATVSALRTALGIPVDLPDSEITTPKDLPNIAEQTREFWPWILLALLALLAIENTLADRRLPSGVTPEPETLSS